MMRALDRARGALRGSVQTKTVSALALCLHVVRTGMDEAN